ncbi:MAG: glutamate-5-semialdehyde dehydrogenase [Oscillospiraceae bacterium]|nr:glutamate-5-semialdehyde dehydrogenase [Oscillospiraceae bacterium]
MSYIDELGMRALEAKKSIATAGTNEKNAALEAIAKSLTENAGKIISANALDLKAAAESGMSPSLQDRLMLNESRIEGIASAVRELIALEDPVGKIDSGSVRPNGMRITKVRVPMGVIGMIYEARPNVTVDAAAICLKTGNAIILRGGKAAYNSNKIISEIMREAVAKAGFNKDIIQLMDDTSRELTTELMKADKYLDLLIPRGGAGLIKSVTQNATVPVIETGTGNCHIFVDESADIDMAVSITNNAKTRRPSVCNAAESLLVHKNIAEKFLPAVKAKLDEHSVEIRGDEETAKILGSCVIPATEEDYAAEFLDYIISVKVVSDVGEAIDHIAKYSTGHSECIVTNDLQNAEKFKHEVDSACVYVNVSTAFTDGGMFGLGAEIGISTQKLHARGPMGLYELTSNKYLIDGSGQIRE